MAGRDPAMSVRAMRLVEIAGPDRAPFDEIVARYLKLIGDPRDAQYSELPQSRGAVAAARSVTR